MLRTNALVYQGIHVLIMIAGRLELYTILVLFTPGSGERTEKNRSFYDEL